MPRRKGLVLLFLALAGSLPALEPPTRAELALYRRDGSFLGRLQRALALGNHRVDPALVQDFGRRLGGRALEVGPLSGRPLTGQTLPAGRRGLPTKGAVKIFALLIDFPDYPRVNDQAVIDSKLFGDGGGGFPYESLRNYYRRSSYGLLDIGGATLGWYTAKSPRSSIAQTTAAREALIREALNQFHGQGFNFAPYDNDGNGVIDYFVVIWTGPNNGWGNFWWGYQTSFSSSFSLDGKTFTGARYSWQWESRTWPGPYDPVVVMHETGHGLGLPDYYDYDTTIGPGGGLGGLDMMDANRGDHNAFSKMLLDWISPQVFNYGNRGSALRASGSSPDALLAMPEFAVLNPFDEFFLIQNRTRAENDLPLPGDGLLIWHVDARLNSQSSDFQCDNSTTGHKLLKLMEADGLESIERGYAAHAADYYLPGSTFGPLTAPGSSRYDGSESGVMVYGISPPGPLLNFTADVHYTLLPPVSPALTRQESDFIFFREYIDKVTWAPNPRNRTTIALYRVFAKPAGSGDDAYIFLGEVSPALELSYRRRGLKKDQTFAYRITAVDRNGVVSAGVEVGR